jgi:hypothetical protein
LEVSRGTEDSRKFGQEAHSGQVFIPQGAPFVPEHLNDAQACAEQIIRHFKTKMLTAPDSYMLAVFATAWSWHKTRRKR